LVTVSTISRAVSRAVFAFALTVGRVFSPFFMIRIVFFSDIAIFRVRMNAVVSNEILATQFRNFLELRTLDADYACKEEATSANAQLVRKKGHFEEKLTAIGVI
jgi:hypothetical protein